MSTISFKLAEQVRHNPWNLVMCEIKGPLTYTLNIKYIDNELVKYLGNALSDNRFDVLEYYIEDEVVRTL